MNNLKIEILEDYLKDADFCEALDDKNYESLLMLTDEEDMHILIAALEDLGDPIPEEALIKLFSDYKDYAIDKKYTWDTYFDLFIDFPYEQQYDLRDYDISRKQLDKIIEKLHEDRVFDTVTTYPDNSDIPYIMSISAEIIKDDELVVCCYVTGEKGDQLAELKYVLPTYKYFKGIPHVGYGYNEERIKSIIKVIFKQVESYL